MKKTIVLLIGVLSLGAVFQDFAFAQQKECPSMNFNIIGARKTLPDEWKPTNEQDELGANFDFTGKEWPISFDVGYLYAVRKGRADEIITENNVSTAFDNLEREASTQELSAGVKKIWMNEDTDLSLFLGGGAAWITGRLAFTDVETFDESKLGWYATTGAYFTVLEFLNLGVLVRYSDTRIDLDGRDLQAG
ncbi:MAG: hypothetical protein ACYC5N_09010, partial [Endomicrobiales bacterium]